MKKYYLKEDVEFEKLKEFGYEYNDYEYQPYIETPNYMKCINEKSWFCPMVFIGCKTRKIQMFEVPDDDFRYNNDKTWINSLIKANLVEGRDE